MVGEIKRNYLSGTKLVTEKRPTWRDSGINAVVNSVAGAVEAGNNYFEREKQLVWKRLNLEAANLQTEELNAIKTAKSIDEIPGIVENFQKKLKDNMRGQKWGKEWMEDLGGGFLSYNQKDVQNAFRAKEKELAGISLNETLKAYADQIAAAPEDEAAFFSADADKLIDSDAYLTPTEKQEAKENFAKLSIGGMVNNNPEVAKKALSDPGRFPNLTDIERKEYLQKADNLLVAKEKDRLAAEERAEKLVKTKADTEMWRANYLVSRGLMSNEEALKIIDDNYAASPQVAKTIREQILSPDKAMSDPDVLKELEEKIKNKTATKEEIVFANIDKALNDEDYKELLAQGKELGLWAKDGEDKDAKYRANLPLIDEGRDAVNQAFVRGDFDKTTRDALLKDIDEKEKNTMAAWEADLKLRMSAGEVVDVDKELANAPYPALATEKVKGLKDYQNEIAKKTEEEKKAEQEKQKAEKEKLDKAIDRELQTIKELKEENQINTYLDLRNQIDEAVNAEGLPGEKEINELVRNGALTEEQAGKLRTAREKKEADFKPKKISEGEKMENMNALQDEKAALDHNPTGEGYARLAEKLKKLQSEGALPKAEATAFDEELSADYDAFDAALMAEEGDAGQHALQSNTINNTIQDYLDKNFKMVSIDEKQGTVAERAVKRAQNTRNARYRVMQRAIYRSALVTAAKKHGLEDTSMKGINDSGQKKVISAEALEETKKLFAQQIYQNADVAAINPTNILSNGNGLQRVISGAEDKGRGEKLIDERPVNVFSYNGHYGVVFSDGTRKEINEEQYNSYKGQK